MLFAIDQQQFLQGYLPIQLPRLHKLYGLMPAGTVMTGRASSLRRTPRR